MSDLTGQRGSMNNLNAAPLIYTTLGNVHISDLDYTTAWEVNDDFIKFTETHALNGEVVKQSAHIYDRKGAFGKAIAAQL